MKRIFAIFLITMMMLSMLCVLTGVGAVEVTPVPEPPVIIVEPQPFFNLTAIVVTVIGLCGVLLTTKLWPLIKANTTLKQQEFLTSMISILVFAAEQLFGALNGAKKMAWVQTELRKRGFDIDIPQIEAAVMALTLEQAAVEYWTYDDEGPVNIPDPIPAPVPVAGPQFSKYQEKET